MPYIGVSPFNGVRKKHTYTATASQTSFSGAGTEGITLSYKDSTFVDVFQNGVKLGEADYTSTSGTAIVLAQGASVNDLIEVVVYDVFSVADTVSKADGGTFDGAVTFGGGVSGVLDADGGITVDNITIDGTEIDLSSGDLTVDVAGDIILDADGGDLIFKDGGTEIVRFNHASENFQIRSAVSDKDIIFQGNDGGSAGTEIMRIDVSERRLGLGTDSPTEKLSIVNGSGDVAIRIQGNTRSFKIEQNNYGLRINDLDADSERFRIDAAGIVTTPLQPAFQAQPTGDNNNVTGDATTFSAVNIAFTEIFDQNADFNHDDGTNRGKFTAPVTGKYLLNLSLFLAGLTSASTSGVASIATSNRTYNFNYNPYYTANVGVNGNYNVSILADMDANDVASFGVYVNGNGSKVVDLAGSQCRFSGHLVC